MLNASSLIMDFGDSMQKIKLLGLDFDGTVAHYPYPSAWEVIAQEIGCIDEDNALRRSYYNGEFDVRTWSFKSVELYKKYGLTRSLFRQLFATKMKPAVGALELLTELHRKKIKTAIISGSIKEVYEIFEKKFGVSVDFVRIAHQFDFDDNGFLSGGYFTNQDFEGKVGALKEICNTEGIDVEECAFVGNGTNDIPIFNTVGMSFAFNPEKQEVVENADVIIHNDDISEVLKYL